MRNIERRLTALDQQVLRSNVVSHVIDVTDATAPAEVATWVDTRLAEISRSGSTKALIIIDK